MATGTPLRIGVVGAGPWAAMVHLPMLARSSDVTCVGLWGRRLEATRPLADQWGVTAYGNLDELIESCDALTFCLPPDVQSDLAPRAARAGKALLLEKPIALNSTAGAELARVVDEAAVPTQLFLTWRYAATVRDYLRGLTKITPTGGRGIFVNGLTHGGVFATPWRLAQGPLFDLGPHVIDLLEAAIGPIVAVRATGELRGWVALSLTHGSGAVSQASLSFGSALDHDVANVEVFASRGHFPFDCTSAYSDATIDTVLSEFVTTVRENRSHVLDVHHGLHLQRLIDDAAAQLRH